MKKNLQIKAKVWRWPGEGGWHFINIDKKLSAEIRKKYPKGFVYVTAQMGKTSWDTALFPHKKSESYLLSIKKNVRKKEDIWEGDDVLVKLKFK